MPRRQSSSPVVRASSKALTGVSGFDQITRGGLPRGRTTLLTGGPGSGKTIFALEFLMHGAQDYREPGVFVAFEETSKRIERNAEAFGWNLAALRPKMLAFMDAQPKADLIKVGDFDLCGMLASLEAQTQDIKARRIVFDALDIVLALLPDAAARRREVHRLHEWLLAHELTALITAKAGGDEASSFQTQPYGFMQFMVDCAVILNHSVVVGVSQRNLRVQKYRGSSFEENESPFIIDKRGIDVASSRPLARALAKPINERVTSGVKGLDGMLGGGYYRGASVLITGFPGTAKTTLSGAFAEAACRRGERTTYVSFDSDASEVTRNLNSVGIRLGRHIKSGLLHFISARSLTGSAETLFVRIRTLTNEHRSLCLVIDPVSTFSKTGNEMTAHGVAERLIDWSKAEGITLICTSLLDETSAQTPGSTSLQISTLADTWIHVSYVVQAGERNRGISIIKSRGSAHSNQVRELILSHSGVTLAETYTAEGAVLMGTMRWEKENDERIAHEVREMSGNIQRIKLHSEEAELQARAKALQAELIAKQGETALLARTLENRKRQRSRASFRLRELRGDRKTIARRKPSP
jgi:circadian clock protein KaiC